MRHEDLVAVWGEDNVRRFDADAVDMLRLPDHARRLLSQVGLPRRVRYFFTSDPAELTRIPLEGPEEGGDGGTPTAVGEDALRVGWNYAGDPIMVSFGSGEVVQRPADSLTTECFVNSSLECFVASMLELSVLQTAIGSATATDRDVRAGAAFPQLDDAEIDEREEQFAQRVREIDPRALADPESWWSGVVEQMRAGLL